MVSGHVTTFFKISLSMDDKSSFIGLGCRSIYNCTSRRASVYCHRRTLPDSTFAHPRRREGARACSCSCSIGAAFGYPTSERDRSKIPR